MNLKNELKKKQTWFVVFVSLILMIISGYLPDLYQGATLGVVLAGLCVLLAIVVVTIQFVIWLIKAKMSKTGIWLFVGLLDLFCLLFWSLIFVSNDAGDFFLNGSLFLWVIFWMFGCTFGVLFRLTMFGKV